jgi:hypothetical protein
LLGLLFHVILIDAESIGPNPDCHRVVAAA